MIPLYDESYHSQKKPIVTIFLIALNTVIFLYFFINRNLESAIFNFGAIPKDILAGKNLKTLVSSMFLHAGFSHLIGNMWFLWIFGDNVENKLGKIKYLIFYLLAGILSAYIHCLTAPSDLKDIPIVGASGAISGILGAYLVLFPRNKIRTFFWFYFRPIFFYVPAFFFIGVWILYQILYLSTISYSAVAYTAHIGGFLAGAILIKPFKDTKIFS
jgi:membrane associated rhomboid family serine protease